jgi:excisionase family DNA binding protein
LAEKLLTVKEAAERLNTSENGLRWQIHQGIAPKSARLGGRRMFRESDIEAFIEAAFEDPVSA